MRLLLILAIVLPVAAGCQKKESSTVSVPDEAPAAAVVEEADEAGGETDPVDSIAIEPAEPKHGESLRAVVGDTRNRVLVFTWYVNGESITGESSDRLPGSFARKDARIKVEVAPSLEQGLGESKSSDEVVVGNTAPRINSFQVISSDGGEIVFQTEADDVDGDALSFRLVSGPSGMSVDDKGVVRWQAPPDFSQVVTFTVAASDGEFEFTLDSELGQR